jgi:hypothetical protein
LTQTLEEHVLWIERIDTLDEFRARPPVGARLGVDSGDLSKLERGRTASPAHSQRVPSD